MIKILEFKNFSLLTFHVMLFVSIHAQADWGTLDLQLAVQNKSINLCDPINVSVLIINNSDRAVTVRNPDVMKGTLRLKVMHEQASIPQTQYSAGQELDTVVIKERDTFRLNFDIRKYFPVILDDGELGVLRKTIYSF